MKDILTLFLCFAIIICSVIFLEHTITPFFVSAVLAYIFHPLVEKTAVKFSINRNIVISFFILLVVFVITGAFAIFVPILYHQINLFLLKVPIYIGYIQNKFLPLIASKTKYLDQNFLLKIDDAFNNILISISNELSHSITNIISYTTGVIEIAIIIILVPIILFYFLRDWPQKFLQQGSHLMTQETQSILRKFLNDVNILLSSYMRGQFNICVIMSIYYSIALSVIGIDLAILIGVISGFAIILPFIGFLVTFIITIILGYFDFGISVNILYICITYIIGSIIEGSILTPKIIGNKIGLHPLWIIFAVLACGNLFGILGMLFAIPIAGIMKICITSGIDLYVKFNKQ